MKKVRFSRGLAADLCFDAQRMSRLCCKKVSWAGGGCRLSGLGGAGGVRTGVAQSSVTDPGEIGVLGAALTESRKWGLPEEK